MKTIPNWFRILLDLRNLFAFIFGLKTGEVGLTFEVSEKLKLKQGQSIGDFLILLKAKKHLIGELKDKHLDFRFSIVIKEKGGKTNIFLNTIVKLNNFFGRIYFFSIKPFHRFIVPTILKRLHKEICYF